MDCTSYCPSEGSTRYDGDLFLQVSVYTANMYSKIPGHTLECKWDAPRPEPPAQPPFGSFVGEFKQDHFGDYLFLPMEPTWTIQTYSG